MYKIHNKEFKTKTEIKKYTSELLINNFGKTLVGDDDLFARELIKYHEHNYKLENVVSISCKDFSNVEDRILPIFIITYKRGNTDHVSLHRCINKIPIDDEPITEYTFKFGKYKGRTVEDINDNNYLKWLINNDVIKDKRIKNHIEQYLNIK
jgi:uncharacterized protein (DUF3820 family)